MTITGIDFGATQGNSTVTFNGISAGQASSWSAGSITVLVPGGAVTGAVVVTVGGSASNPVSFALPPPPGGNLVVPSLLNMSVGDTHTIQALNAASQPVSGLTWTSSNPAIVSLSTDDPPLLTALAAGHVNITAGTGSSAATAAVTVFAGPLPLGSPIWSNPGDGSGVAWIVPAVPSTSGVADIFAFQNDGKVQAITSDGTVAWTADVSRANYGTPGWILPDFQGGLVFTTSDSTTVRLGGLSGQPDWVYPGTGESMAIHPDGTVFLEQVDTGSGYTVVGINPTTGSQKFSVTAPINGVPPVWGSGSLIIAGDGYAYYSYPYLDSINVGSNPAVCHLSVLRIDTSGNYTTIPVFTSTCGGWPGGAGHSALGGARMITNADQGILLTWGLREINAPSVQLMATITGGVATVVGAPPVPGGGQVYPVLQAQDGSFIGNFWDVNTGNSAMVAFNATGTVRWTVPNETPQIATADGGVIGQSGITYDQYGNATGMGALPIQSWTGNAYQVGSVDQVTSALVDVALSFNAFLGGNPSGNGTAAKVVMSPMFVPFSLTDFPVGDFSIIFGLSNNFDTTKIALYPLLTEDAKSSTFRNYLARTNVVVGYIDHGLLVSGQPNAFGLCFADTCLAPTPLLPQCQLSAPGTQTECLPNGFQPKAKLVMLAICGVDEAFIGQWHLPPTGQALIVPVYSSGNTALELSLGWAAAEWRVMLLDLANGYNVEAAVNDGNAKATATQSEHTWQIIGDPFVTFHAQSQ